MFLKYIKALLHSLFFKYLKFFILKLTSFFSFTVMMNEQNLYSRISSALWFYMQIISVLEIYIGRSMNVIVYSSQPSLVFHCSCIKQIFLIITYVQIWTNSYIFLFYNQEQIVIFLHLVKFYLFLFIVIKKK